MSMRDRQAGTAHFATEAEIAAAGLFERQPGDIYAGCAYGRPLYVGVHGTMVCGGAGGGKLTNWAAQNICRGAFPNDSLILADQKGEIYCIAQNQVGETPKRVVCFNPLGLHGAPSHKLNVVSHLKLSTSTLVMDMQAFWETFAPVSAKGDDEYFVQGAHRLGLAIALALVEEYGELELPDLYRIIQHLPGGGRTWRDFQRKMERSRFPEANAAAEEIEAGRANSAGGFPGFLGELSKAVNCLASPQIQEALSGPFDLRMEDLFDAEEPTHLHLMVPGEMISKWKPVLTTTFASAMLIKSRRPGARKLRPFVDEAGQLPGFEQITNAYVFGRGLGIDPVTIWQAGGQMARTSANAENIIPSSAGLKIFFNIRDLETARLVSQMMGVATIKVDDPIVQHRAQWERHCLLASVMGGANPFTVASQMRQKAYEAVHTLSMGRLLMTPDEVMNLPPDMMIVFVKGVPGPIIAMHKPYWEQEWMAGRYQPNPLHPPLDSVIVQTAKGPQSRRVMEEPVPDHLAHLPQYAGGTWSYIEGYRP